MMMVNLELERRLQWSRREGGGGVGSPCQCCAKRAVSLGKKKGGRENSVEKVRSNSSMFDNLFFYNVFKSS